MTLCWSCRCSNVLQEGAWILSKGNTFLWGLWQEWMNSAFLSQLSAHLHQQGWMGCIFCNKLGFDCKTPTTAVAARCGTSWGWNWPDGRGNMGVRGWPQHDASENSVVLLHYILFRTQTCWSISGYYSLYDVTTTISSALCYHSNMTVM
jgi:hypothetical protein